jgi:ABC-type Mn2+/Zn2+ transport system permease subunit
MGTVVSALGVYASLMLDLPTGATIVCTFGVALVIMAVLRPLIQGSAVSHQPSTMSRSSRAVP